MSTDIVNNQTKNALSGSVAATSQVSQPNRQNVAAAVGTDLPPQETQQQEVSSEQLQQVVEKLNDHVQNIQRDLHFSVDDDSGRTVIRVVNTETEEVVRQIPSEEVLRISSNIQQQLDDLKGLLFETSA